MKNKQTTKKWHHDRKWALLLLVNLLLFSNLSLNAQIAGWDFTGASAPATFAATTYNANLDASNLVTRGATAAASAGANSFRTTGFQNNGISVANTDFFQITLSAATGYTMSLSTIDARLVGTGTFAASPGVTSQFAYSTDGTTFTLIATPQVIIGTPQTLAQINLAGISALQNVTAATTITIRYYASGQTTTGGWGFNSPAAGNLGLAIGGSVNALPSITPSAAPVSGLNYTFGSGPSASTSFTFTGANLIGAPGNITVDASGTTGYEVSTDNATFSSSVTYAYGSATLAAQTVYVRLKAGLAVGAYNNQSITISGGGASSSKTASGDVVPPTPILTLSTPALTGFNYIFGFGPSTSQSFTVTGSNLAPANSNVVIDAGITAYEVSTDNINFFSSVSLPYSGVNLATTTVYIRLAASQAVGPYNLQAITATAGATSTSLNASGDVSPQIPVITVGAITPSNSFSTNFPTPSSSSTFTVTGQFLTNPLTIGALSGYEYSDNGGFTWNSSLTYTTATVNKTISVRLIGSPAGSYNGTIVVTSVDATNSPASLSVTGDVFLVPTLTEVILPQFIQGVTGTNNDRLPYAFRATINNLTPLATYRYFNSVVLPSEIGTSNGAGNPIFVSSGAWVRSTGGNLSSAGNYAEFSTDASGTFTGWFVLEPTANSRFVPGSNIHMNISLNDGAGGNTVVSRVTTTNTVKVINFNSAAGPNNGTGIRSVSNAQAKDFIFLYDNDMGTGRPIAGTYFESDGTSGGTAYAGFYETAVEGQAKAWGTIIPNTLPNGIRYVASYSQATGSQLCTFSDDDGVWPTGNINTVNPTGFTTNTAIVLSNTDVPMQCFLLPYVNLSASLTSGTEVGSTVITLTATITGTIASAQSIDINVAGLDITGADYTLSSATINFAAGVNPTGTATFTIQNDLLFEGLETATISLLNPSSGIELGFNTVVEIDIVDDEIPKIVINEIMYNNIGGDEEWIELYNNDIVPITIDSTWNITGTPSSGPAWTRFFAGSTSILFSPGQYITVRLGSASAGASFPFAPTLSLSTTADQLTNTGAPIILKKGSAIIDNVTYSPVTFTPAANGGGPSLSLNNPSFDNSLAASWGACKINGTPGLANFNCDASTFYSILSGDLNPEVWNATTAIWSTSPTGTEGLIPTFTSTRNLVIQTGTTVRLNYVSTVPSANNITINNGGKLWTDNAVSGSEKYIRLHGNIINNGIVGNGVTYDALGLSIEGINSTLSGTGSYNIGRIRKDLVTNPISMVTINANVNLRHAGAAFYNNIGGSTLNLTINPGRFLNFTDATGDLAIDGVDGTGLGDRRGNIVVNGILNVSDKIFALTNNTSAASCSMTINATGRVITGNMDANISGSGGAIGAFDVTINAGGRLEINKILKVISGDLNSNGGIILRSTNTQTALIDGSGSGNVTGNVTVERKIGPTYGYHYLSSPVQGVFVNNSVSGWRDDFTIIASLDNLQFIPGNVYTALPTVFEYDETNLNPNPSFGWIGATGTTDAITPLKGFACIVSANVTVDVVGVVNNGPINYTVTKASDGINIIGNPYPSPISWTAFRSHNTNLETTYKAFVTTGGYNGSYGDYNIATGLGTNGVGNIIASSQGFLVTAITAGPIQAINTDRTLDLNPTYFTQPVVNADILRLDVVKDNAHDETVIFFAPALATDSYEAIADVKKLMPFNTNHSFIYSVNGNNQLSMNGLGAFDADKMIPLGIKVSESGLHQIVATDLSTFSSSAMIYLLDTQNGTVQNLRNNPSYSVQLNAGTHEGRFFIQFVPAVQLNSQNADCNGHNGKVNLVYNSNAVLQVSVKNEVGSVVATLNNFNGQHTISGLPMGNYEITYQHSNGNTSIDYFTISGETPVLLNASASSAVAQQGEQILFSSVSSTGNTHWDFGDGLFGNGSNVNHVFNNSGIYTVIATASNGVCDKSVELSIEVSSATGLSTKDLTALQFMLTQQQIIVKQTDGFSENATIELIDITGKQIYSNTINRGQVQHAISTAQLSEGVYLVKITSNNQVSVKKMMVSK